MSRLRAQSATILGKHVDGHPVTTEPEPTPAFRWRGAAVLVAAALYTLLFAVRGPAPPLFLGLPSLYLSLPLKVLPALLLSSFARMPGVIPHGALAGSPISQHKLYVARGLVLSAAGDLLLDLCELPALKDVAFLVGLVAFLSAHILYAIGFYWTTSKAVNALVAVACVLPCTLVTSLLAPHILGSPEHAPLFGPVCVYVCVITCMWYFSLVRDSNGSSSGTRAYYMTVAGATLFVLSDVALAFDKFAPPPRDDSGNVRWWFSQPKVVVMVTYYAAQCLIASGAWASTEGRPKGKKA